MALQLYLKDGKWYGNEFPDEPIPYGVGDEQYYGARMDEYNAAVEKNKSEALEVSNPEVLPIDSCTGTIYWLGDEPGQQAREVKEGVLYPWEGKWQIIYQFRNTAIWHDCVREVYKENNENYRKLLRLLPKSPVTPEGSKEVYQPKATTEYRRRTPEESIQRFLKDQEDEQEEIWNEVLNTCEQHVINDIRLLEKLSKLYTITRKP